MKLLSLLLFFITSFIVAKSQGTFQIVFDQNYYDAYSQQSPDGNYVVSFAGDSALLKIDSNANQIWSKIHPFSIESFKIDSLGRMWCGGQNSVASNDDAVMSLLDASGDSLWTRTYHTTYYQARVIEQKISPTGNGYFLVMDDVPGLSNNFYMYNLNNLNDSISYNLPLTTDFYFTDIDEICRLRSNVYTQSITVSKTDTNGIVNWSKVIEDTSGSNGFDTYSARRIIQSHDGNLLVAGDYTPVMGNMTGMILKLDSSNGDTINSLYTLNQSFDNIITTNDGGYAATSSNTILTLHKLDSALNILWSKNFAGTGYSGANSLQQTFDNGFLIGGFTTTSLATIDSFRPYLVKTDGAGNTAPLTTAIYSTEKDNTVSIYPNPFSTSATIPVNINGNAILKIYNIFGESVEERIINTPVIEKGKLITGIYLFELISGVDRRVGKFVIN